MKKILFFIFTLLLTSNVFATNFNREFRGMWVITWEVFKKSEEAKEVYSPEKIKSNIISILDNLKEAGFNAVVWQVRQGGTVYYDSDIEPYGKYLNYKRPGFDPFAFAIEEAHKRGLEIHAWFNTFEARSVIYGSPAFEHPEWVNTNKDGKHMTQRLTISPGLPQVREYLHSVALEIVEKYDIDGLHLDYVRWSEESDSGDYLNPDYIYDIKHPYSDTPPAGFNSWDDWRRDSVTTFVRDLKKKILNSSKPYINLNMAALGMYNWGWSGYYSVFQDSAHWFNQGYVDQIMGMHYYWYDYDSMRGVIGEACPKCWSDYIKPGIARGGRFSVGVGSLMLREKDLWDNHDELVDAIRSYSWTAGVQFFSYGDWLKKNYFSHSRGTFFKEKALPPTLGRNRAMPVHTIERVSEDQFKVLSGERRVVLFTKKHGNTEILKIQFSKTIDVSAYENTDLYVSVLDESMNASRPTKLN